MKKIIVALIFTLTISAGAMAQGRGGGEKFTPEKRAEMQTKRMSEQLNLSDEQQAKLLALNVERNKKSAELNREGATKRKEIHQDYAKELNTILTPEQQEKLKNARKEGRGSREGMKRGGKPGNRPAKPQK